MAMRLMTVMIHWSNSLFLVIRVSLSAVFEYGVRGEKRVVRVSSAESSEMVG